jgi:hypothetical protein
VCNRRDGGERLSCLVCISVHCRSLLAALFFICSRTPLIPIPFPSISCPNEGNDSYLVIVGVAVAIISSAGVLFIIRKAVPVQLIKIGVSLLQILATVRSAPAHMCRLCCARCACC